MLEQIQHKRKDIVMIFHPVSYKWCGLTEACEWIAFGWKPVSLIYKHVDGGIYFN